MTPKPTESILGVDLDTYVPAVDILGDLRVEPITYVGVVDAAIVLVRVLDADGDAYWQIRTTPGVSIEEIIGVLAAKQATVTGEYLRGAHLPSSHRDED